MKEIFKNIEKPSEPIFDLKNIDNETAVITFEDLNELARLGEDVCLFFDKTMRDCKEYLLKGDELRPQGVYAIWLDKKKKKLYVQNRNARGVKEYNDKVKEAVEKSM